MEALAVTPRKADRLRVRAAVVAQHAAAVVAQHAAAVAQQHVAVVEDHAAAAASVANR
jgi:hypothetical protein